ncbi:MAG: hypothetical protein LBJ64_03600 [Deltaproteobacteria bacterium]|jgi:hypothetical protein|nr:hypothetical protein [Deltaproteobacteria bacterium]
MKNYFVRFCVVVLSVCLSLPLFGAVLFAQDNAASQPPIVGTDIQNQLETLHLNTIGTYSAGFVLQSYGYIGVLADVLSQKVYDRDIVQTMLKETIVYINNASAQLASYKSPQFELSREDLAFLNRINAILLDLAKEAGALADFAESRNNEDLKRFHDARNDAWSGIKTTLGLSN